MEKQISELSVVELKALSYDCIMQIEISQNNLRSLNQELSKRAQQNQTQTLDPIPASSIQTV